MNKLIVSLSPHVHGGDSVKKNMYGVLVRRAHRTAAGLPRVPLLFWSGCFDCDFDFRIGLRVL